MLANVIFGVRLIFCGVNLPLGRLPHWMSTVSPWLPLTHGIAAARELADGTGRPLVHRDQIWLFGT